MALFLVRAEMSKIEYHVKIGKLRTGGAGEVLKTVLGSCVGIALVWRAQRKTVLAHCLLPEPSAGESDCEARYVSKALPKMLERIGATPSDIPQLEAIVVGGGQMMDVDHKYTKYVVGAENLRMAKKVLEEHRIKIIAFEPGGDSGTKIRIDCETGQFEIQKIPKVA